MNHDRRNASEKQARRRRAVKTGWFIHATVFVVVNVGLWALNQATGADQWHRFPLWGWGLGLAIHGLVVLIRLHGLSSTRQPSRELSKS